MYSSVSCVAFESYVRINQLNSRNGKLTMIKLHADATNKFMHHNYMGKLLNCIFRSTISDLNTSKLEYCKDCRILWTTYKNVSLWFGNWVDDLVNLCFAFEDNDGNVIIPDEQLRGSSSTFDEMCLSIDGSEGRRGGIWILFFMI